MEINNEFIKYIDNNLSYTVKNRFMPPSYEYEDIKTGAHKYITYYFINLKALKIWLTLISI